jgi:hypothetical protein
VVRFRQKEGGFLISIPPRQVQSSAQPPKTVIRPSCIKPFIKPMCSERQLNSTADEFVCVDPLKEVHVFTRLKCGGAIAV